MQKIEGNDTFAGFEKVNTGRPLFREIVKQIEAQVTSGQLKPGNMLPPERVLGEWFGVSRTVIREALKALELRGLVEVQHGRGVMITQPTAEMLEDSVFHYLNTKESSIWALHELRSILEIGSVRLAAARRTNEDVSRLHELVNEMTESVDDPINYMELDLAFHRALTEAAHNPLTGPLLEPLAKLMREARLIGSRAIDAPRRSIKDHLAIVEAVEEQDGERAVEVMKQHFDRIARFLLEAEELNSQNEDQLGN